MGETIRSAPCVLVVEDNPVNLELIEALLETEGCRILAAMTADEGIRLARRDQPALILMDLHLPGRTGYDAVREIKADPATADIPVVAVTAQAMAGDRERALEAGCDDYCTKPLATERFRTILRRYIRQQGFEA